MEVEEEASSASSSSLSPWSEEEVGQSLEGQNAKGVNFSVSCFIKQRI